MLCSLNMKSDNIIPRSRTFTLSSIEWFEFVLYSDLGFYFLHSSMTSQLKFVVVEHQTFVNGPLEDLVYKYINLEAQSVFYGCYFHTDSSTVCKKTI